jgi:integrase
MRPYNSRQQIQTEQHTLGHRECPACEATRRATMYPILVEMPFAEAAGNFIESLTSPVPYARARYRSRNTLLDYRKKIQALNAFFATLTLSEIHLGNFREYQNLRSLNPPDSTGTWRCLGGKVAHGPYPDREAAEAWGKKHGGNYQIVQTVWAHPAGPSKVNGELGLLERLMKLAGAWTPELERYYERFVEDEGEIPRALSPEEQERFLEVASGDPDWEVVYWYSLVALHTAFSSDELRAIRQGDINLNYGILAVNRRIGKNKFRRREIALTDSACLWALERLLERAWRLGGKGPERYLFPFRVARNFFDGSRPMSETGIRKQFEAARFKAGVPWFQLNGWRHTAATRMAEAGVPQAIRSARMGHTSAKMTAHYEHIALSAERRIMTNMGLKKPVVSIEGARLRRQLAGY